jgi:hypothetical protein
MKMFNLRSENGKHIVTHKGKEIKFNTVRVALIFIKVIKEAEESC